MQKTITKTETLCLTIRELLEKLEISKENIEYQSVQIRFSNDSPGEVLNIPLDHSMIITVEKKEK